MPAITADARASARGRAARRAQGPVQILATLALLCSLLGGAFPALTPAAAAAPGPGAVAISFNVNDPADAPDLIPGDTLCLSAAATCTLRAAIQEANALAEVTPAETFAINLAAGTTYTLSLVNDENTPEDAAARGDLDIKANVTINGNGATINGYGSVAPPSQRDRVFHVFATTGGISPAPIAVELNSLIVTAGYLSNGNGGGILADDFGGGGPIFTPLAASQLTLRAMTVTGNTAGGSASSFGGGVYNGEGRTLIVSGSTISNNGASLGGGLFNFGTLSMAGATVQDNLAGGGAGLFNPGTATIEGSTFRANSAAFFGFGSSEAGGGGIANVGTLTLTGSRVVGNSAVIGGGISAASAPFFGGGDAGAGAPVTTTLVNSEIAGNSALFFGGGIANVANPDDSLSSAVGDTALTMRGGTIANNSVAGFFFFADFGGSGGGLANYYGTAELIGVSITSNSAIAFGTGQFSIGSGGGVFNLGALAIDQSALTGNFVAGAGLGGGIANGFSNRFPSGGPGPILFGDVGATDLNTNLTVSNTTFSGNSAPGGGGALVNADDSVATLNGTTIANNSSGVLTYDIVTEQPTAQASTTTILNSILAANAEYNCSGTTVNGGYNIDSGATCAFGTAAGSLSDTDPRLAPLALNAPGTTPTYATLPGSPALDRVPTAGAGCPATDQRGVARPQGAGCDVGAYESLVGSFNVTLSVSGPGTVDRPSGTASYPAGSTQTFTATPNGGDVVFIGWTVDGTFVGFGNPLALPVTKDRTVVALFAAIPAFCDVTPSTPGAVAIRQLAARGVIFGSDNPNGPGKCFLPGDTLLRIHVAGMVARAFGWDGEDHGNTFTDQGEVDNDLWRNAGTLAFYDVARGYRDDTYDPTGPVLHAHAISFVTRAMVRKGYWTQQADNAAYYPGVPEESGHRIDAVTYYFYAGNIVGTAAPTDPWDGPNGYAGPSSRAYFAQVLWQAYSSYFSTNRIP